MSLFITTFLKITTMLLAITFVICMALQIPFLLISIIVRSIVSLLAKVFHPEYDSLLTSDAAPFTFSPLIEPGKTINMFSLCLFDGQVTVEKIRQLTEENVLGKRGKGGGMVYKRLQQTWTTYLGYAFWKKDQNFSLSNHIRQYDYKDNLALPDPCRLCDIEQVLGKLLALPWTNHQSPWEILTVNNFIVENSSERKTIAITRVSHALADGYSIIGILKVALNAKFELPKIQLNRKQFSFLQKLGLIFKVPYDFCKDSMAVTRVTKLYNKPLLEVSIVSISPVIPVSLIKQIKTHYKVSYAAVLHAAVQGAILTAMKSAQVKPTKNVLCYIPVPMPNHPGGMVNHVTTTMAVFPCESSSPVQRLYKIQEKIELVSQSTSGLGVFFLSRIISYYPHFINQWCWSSAPTKGFEYIFSTFPATISADYCDNVEITELTLGVRTCGGMGIAVCTGGANNKQRITFTASKDYFGSEAVTRNLGKLVIEELQALALV